MARNPFSRSPLQLATLLLAFFCSALLLDSCEFTGKNTSSSSVSSLSLSDASLLYVSKQGDTMTGALNLPTDGLVAGTTELVLSGGEVGIGTSSPGALLDVNGSAHVDSMTLGKGPGEETEDTALGIGAIFSNVSGNGNTAIGNQAIDFDTTGSNNTAVGYIALRSGMSGNDNTAAGAWALLSTNLGSSNSALGSDAIFSTNSTNNTAAGTGALSGTGGTDNTAVGDAALTISSSGNDNTLMGFQSALHASGGSGNTAVGSTTLGNLTSGSNNTAIGISAGGGITTGSGNVIIGKGTGLAGALTNNIVFADGVGNKRIYVNSLGEVGIGVSNAITMLQVAGEISPSVTNTDSLGDASLLWSAVYAQNGTIQTSDARKKKEITSCDLGLSFINRLRPVSYRWKSGPDVDLHYGLIAQETEAAIERAKAREGKKVSPNDPIIVSYDKKADVYGMKYSELISPVIEAIQEISKKLKAPDRELASLRAENARIRAENAELLQLVCQKHPSAKICSRK